MWQIKLVKSMKKRKKKKRKKEKDTQNCHVISRNSRKFGSAIFISNHGTREGEMVTWHVNV